MNQIIPLRIIEKYYDRDSTLYKILIIHSAMVTRKALELAARVPHLHPDLLFIRQAAMLHDIGIFVTNAPEIFCYGEHPYLMHGPFGRELLEKEGLARHALVCDRHTGVGLSKEDIINGKMPLPPRDMLPISIEEKIICFADTFYGKNFEKLCREKSIERIAAKVAEYGGENPARLQAFRELFKI